MPKQNSSPRRYELSKHEFNKLQQKWYSKLSNSPSPHHSPTSQNQPKTGLPTPKKAHKTHLPSALSLSTTEYYYKIAKVYLKRTDFKKPHKRMIWRLHCRGLTYREIAKKLKLKYGKYSINTVWSVLCFHKPLCIKRAIKALQRQSRLKLSPQQPTSAFPSTTSALSSLQQPTTPFCKPDTALNLLELKALLEKLYKPYKSGRVKRRQPSKLSKRRLNYHVETIKESMKLNNEQLSLELMKLVEEYNPDTPNDYDPSANTGILL